MSNTSRQEVLESRLDVWSNASIIDLAGGNTGFHHLKNIGATSKHSIVCLFIVVGNLTDHDGTLIFGVISIDRCPANRQADLSLQGDPIARAFAAVWNTIPRVRIAPQCGNNAAFGIAKRTDFKLAEFLCPCFPHGNLGRDACFSLTLADILQRNIHTNIS